MAPQSPADWYEQVADGIAEGGVPRDQLFIVSKLWNTFHRPENCEKDLDITLKSLNTDYLDVWLMHWPVPFVAGAEMQPMKADGSGRAIDTDAPSIVETWKAMIQIWKTTKKAKAIGVSNCSVELLEKMINATGVVPAMNQIEAHPSLQQPELYKYCESLC